MWDLVEWKHLFNNMLSSSQSGPIVGYPSMDMKPIIVIDHISIKEDKMGVGLTKANSIFLKKRSSNTVPKKLYPRK